MKAVALRRLIASVDNGTWGSDEGTSEVDVTCVRAADFDFDRMRADLSRAPTRSIDCSVARRLRLNRGDLVLEKSGGGEGAPVGRAVLFDEDAVAVTSNFAARVRPVVGVEPDFLNFLLRSLYDCGVTRRCIKQTTGIQNLDTEHWLQTRVTLPSIEEQRRIADFLDDRVARIDRIIEARRRQIALAHAASQRASYDTVRGSGRGATRPSGLGWLGQIPSSWAVCAVATEFQVDLGKMLDEKRQTGTDTIPYLRNTNVQWDRVDLEDLKSMDIAPEERPRYTVKTGDLLICEGGQPGRAAIWPGGMEPLGFQKALHRARSRGRSRAGWLLECLRAAVLMNVFENGQTTIGHLTNEQMRAVKFPFPEPSVQDAALAELRAVQESGRVTVDGLARSIDLLSEYKQSLITAAVTGELDVTTAGSGIPG